jgi:hypothetical protein
MYLEFSAEQPLTRVLGGWVEILKMYRLAKPANDGIV